jgi:hypothetical protein
MIKKKIEQLLKGSPELAVSDNLKSIIMARAAQAEDTKLVLFPINVPDINRTSKIRRYLAACVAAFVLICAAVTALYFEEYETVYLDINPSVALSVNRFETVNRVTFINTDSYKTLSDVKLKGRPIKKAVNRILKAYRTGGILREDSEVYVSTFSRKNRNSEKLTEKIIRGILKNNRKNPISVNKEIIGSKEREEAKKSGVSPVKYKLIQRILAQDGNTYTFEDLKIMTMAELKGLLRSKIDEYSAQNSSKTVLSKESGGQNTSSTLNNKTRPIKDRIIEKYRENSSKNDLSERQDISSEAIRRPNKTKKNTSSVF